MQESGIGRTHFSASTWTLREVDELFVQFFIYANALRGRFTFSPNSLSTLMGPEVEELFVQLCIELP